MESLTRNLSHDRCVLDFGILRQQECLAEDDGAGFNDLATIDPDLKDVSSSTSGLQQSKENHRCRLSGVFNTRAA